MRAVIRLLLAISALGWWVLPGMGVIDLSVTWDKDWLVMLEAGWGLLFTVGVGVPLLLTALRPRAAPIALLQLYVVLGSLLVGAVAGREPQTWWIFALLAVDVALLHLLARGHETRLGPVHRPLALLAAVGAGPALTYAWTMAERNRQSLPSVTDITNDVDHYAVQAALAVALIALTVVTAVRPDARRLLGSCTAVMAAYLGLVSLGWPGAVAGFGRAWSVATMIWAAAILLLAWRPTTPGGSRELRPAD